MDGNERGSGVLKVALGGMPDREKERHRQEGKMELTEKAKRNDAGGKIERMEVRNKGLTERCGVRKKEEGESNEFVKKEEKRF